MPRQFSADEPELLDLPQPFGPELARDLSNLASLNRHFGSHSLVRGYLRGWLMPGRKWRVLDLATGAGDIPRLIATWAAERGVEVEIDGVDFNAGSVEYAQRQTPAGLPIRWICDDALSFTAEEPYDLVCCSLAVHHFSEEDAVRLLANIRRLTRRYALVADLERGAFTTVGIWLLTTLFYRDHMTKFDGMLSARRAFTMPEMHVLAEKAGWEGFGHRRHLPCRQALTLG